MNRDDIIRTAHEAGLHIATDVNWMPIIGLEYLEKFAALVSAEWQEKCNTYIELHDAVVKDSDRLYALNAELVEALEYVIKGVPSTWVGVMKAQTVLEKVKGDSNG